MPQTLKVQCPECNRLWTAYDGDPAIDCTCHLICPDGTKTSDCTLIDARDPAAPDYFRGQYGWPAGQHLGRDKIDDNVPHRKYYCTVHSRYTNKDAVSIDVDWKVTSGFNRSHKKLRFDREV